MLQELRVDNFALIREAALDFGPGLNVLTGETGAGKSILVNSMKLLLGERAEARSLRKGAELGRVEGVFQLEAGGPAEAALRALGLEAEEGLLILTRELGARGKNTCRINRRTVTLRDFQQVSRHLITIFGQHDHVTLTDPEQQLALLDSLGDADHRAQMEAVAVAYRDTRQCARHLKAFIDQASERESRRRRAEMALADLEPLKLQAGEEKNVTARYQRVMAAEELQADLTRAYGALYEDEGAAQARVRDALDALRRAAAIDPTYKSLAKELGSALITIEETARSLLGGVDIDPGEAERLSERMALYERLRRSYGMNVDELIQAMDAWQADIANDEGAALELESLRDRYLEAKAVYEAQAEQLRQSRQAIARRFEAQLLEELSDLAMAHARFEVAFQKAPAGRRGEDQVTFMLSANPGSDLAPLQDIASGGEMSRIMLAFKTILAGVQGVETLIFDEIDTGIGGITLNAVADKLARVAKGEQVICVTHAAPIAARATTHFHIAKKTDGAHTDMTVRRLPEEEQSAEIARMLGGEEDWHLAYAERLREDSHDHEK